MSVEHPELLKNIGENNHRAIVEFLIKIEYKFYYFGGHLEHHPDYDDDGFFNNLRSLHEACYEKETMDFVCKNHKFNTILKYIGLNYNAFIESNKKSNLVSPAFSKEITKLSLLCF